MRALFRTAVPILLLVACAARAVEIDVSGRAIEIPLPPGYSELTPEMSPVYEAMYSYVVPSNERYMIILPTEITESILRGEDAVYERYMVIESERQTARQTFSTQTFAEFRGILRDQLDEIFESVRQELPEIASDASQSVSEAIGEDLELSIGEIVPLAVHLETENAMAYSQYVNYGAAVGGEDMGNTVVAATTAFVHVREKILFVYVYGAEGDLEWTREFTSNWLAQIFEANAEPVSVATTYDADETNRPEASPERRGMDWGKVLERGLIGALIGAVVGIFAMLRSRRRKDQS